MAATWQDVSRKGQTCRPSQETWSGDRGYMECVKKCAFKKFSWEAAGTSSCIVQGGVLIFKSTPRGLSSSMSDQVWWWWIQPLWPLYPSFPSCPGERKGMAAQRAESLFVGNDKGREGNLPCFLPDQWWLTSRATHQVKYPPYPLPQALLHACFHPGTQRGHHRQHQHNHRAWGLSSMLQTQ